MSPLTHYDREHIADLLANRGLTYSWFTAQLLRLIAHADRANRERLRLAYPDEVAAFEQWQTTGSAMVGVIRMGPRRHGFFTECPLCGEATTTGWPHSSCVAREQAEADRAAAGRDGRVLT